MSRLLALAVPSVALATAVGVPLRAWWLRGRTYATFSAVVLAIALPGAVVLHGRLAALVAPAWQLALDVGFTWGMAAAGLHLAGLARARLRARPMRWVVSIPGMAFLAMGALASAWLLALLPVRVALHLAGFDGTLTVLAWLDFAPLVVAAASVITSLRTGDEVVRIALDDTDHPSFTRLDVVRHRRPAPAPGTRPLRIVQITDPHLGPWQPVHRLHDRLTRLMKHDPDLILLTGDYLTMESAATPGSLAAALEPLAPFADRSFAVFGNHDHEARDEVRHGLATNGITLLVDDATTTMTPVGPVQLVGADWVRRKHREHLSTLCARHPRRDGHLRFLLLHDPIGFTRLPPGEADLVFSGHTHGGHVGLVSLGLEWTALSRTRWPDHGLFGHGTNRLYVHRGTGFYGFPMRVGVPGEASLLEVSI